MDVIIKSMASLLQPLDIFQNSLFMEIMDVGSLMLGARLLIHWIY
jgi:hypothetical protein